MSFYLIQRLLSTRLDAPLAVAREAYTHGHAKGASVAKRARLIRAFLRLSWAPPKHRPRTATYPPKHHTCNLE